MTSQQPLTPAEIAADISLIFGKNRAGWAQPVLFLNPELCIIQETNFIFLLKHSLSVNLYKMEVLIFSKNTTCFIVAAPFGGRLHIMLWSTACVRSSGPQEVKHFTPHGKLTLFNLCQSDSVESFGLHWDLTHNIFHWRFFLSLLWILCHDIFSPQFELKWPNASIVIPLEDAFKLQWFIPRLETPGLYWSEECLRYKSNKRPTLPQRHTPTYPPTYHTGKAKLCYSFGFHERKKMATQHSVLSVLY